jgi:hypothetical protein
MKDRELEIDDLLDKYECENCDGVLARRINYHNTTCEDEIRFCPFCGEEY